MDELPIFTAALDIRLPWYIKRVHFEFENGVKKLYIQVAHTRRTKFPYEGVDCPVYDHQERSWKHLNFFQHECYIYGRIPRVKAPDGTIKLVKVPWAMPGSSFTLLFEYNVLNLMLEGMSASSAGRHTGICGKRVFRIVKRHVGEALCDQGLSPVKALSVDETSTRKGHHYLTVLADRQAKKVVGIAPGKSQEAFNQALVAMEVRGAGREDVRSVTMDMSKSYIAGVCEAMPQADIVFDRFHIAKQLNEAIDEIRRQEQRQYNELKGSRYLWLRNNASLTVNQRERVDILAEAYPTLGQAYRLRELFKQVMDEALVSTRLRPLNDWIKAAWASGIKPIQDFVNMLRSHWYGVKTYFKKVADNAFAERVNLKIQEIKRIAKGYRNINNFILMIYFHIGGLELQTHSK